ncbi:hypothetical protein [uncultured Methylobacterium sp.]|uniref:hypothetical protein n=1 Tax=uncultured Methylobacterium sp. TaxID=157278 RepID=UPI00260793E6|nr:hypothetical protein [uncultured Methylobacterium sp.]
MGSAAAGEGRIVRADVVALDQLLVYNRFGSFNPYGMIFALRRDVSSADEPVRRPDADACGTRTGTEPGRGVLRPGHVRLKDCKRPRPLVLRVNAGDILEISLTNLLRNDQPGISEAFAEPSGPTKRATPRGPGFCREPSADAAVAPVRPDLRKAFDPGRDGQCREADEARAAERGAAGDAPGADWPRTRTLSLAMPGLEALEVGTTIDPACLGLSAVAPGATIVCRWRTDREGTHLFSSLAAPAGGEGDAGSLGHGLFGALIVEPTGSRAFRSQVTSAAFDRIWAPGTAAGARPHAREGEVDFGAAQADPPGSRADSPCAATPVPILELHRPCGGTDGQERVEIVHGDLNAIVVPQATGPRGPAGGTPSADDLRLSRMDREAGAPFREYTVIFHDELKTFYADAFKQLDRFAQLSGVRDGFAINYGASGVGSALLANRLKIGPAANCPECLYEEFFLESWANGDPALLEAFPDDPSNVHHSYLNDKVVFRNFHAGKETHVFHLHSHQWFAGNDAGRGAYLDSQTIGPQQGFTYRIYHGGQERYLPQQEAGAGPKGWWSSLGSGNRNRTPGDAIFHCHLYPHFAQGMWALWRVHDVLEDGTRLLPDGQARPGLSVAPDPDPAANRRGSVGPLGERLVPATRRADLGTPIPGLVPLPGTGLPPLPSYAPGPTPVAAAAAETDAMPGYPFYIPGRPGHRSPQPPLDMARAAADPQAGITPAHVAALAGRTHLDGGLPRHVVTGGVAVPNAVRDLPPGRQARIAAKGGLLATMLARGDMTSHVEHLDLELLPQDGTVLERSAMRFHGTGAGVAVVPAHPGTAALAQAPVAAPGETGLSATALDPATGAYLARVIPADAIRGKVGDPTRTVLAPDGSFAVNGSPGAPGAPYADPCAAPLVLGLPNGPRHRRFDPHAARWGADEPFQVARDPFGAGTPLAFDPGLTGFRRFHVSAVETTLVVNRAGWHDPQARINVLSAEAARFKNRTRSDAEPFFFRGFSGECIEFHHTNETPKDLALDDFQLKVPTDTIGQHIHLVKFDVTSSDGSGNGFNYEDGTFAPDEVLTRLCAARGRTRKRAGEDPARIADPAPRTDEECGEDFIEGVSKRVRLDGDNIRYFQTTVQRWFADPILSDTGAGHDVAVADRTLRTVFTHDHFGPSNIQQHGFYAALLIEPSPHAVCPLAEPRSDAAVDKGCVAGPAAAAPVAAGARATLAAHPARDLIGARASVFRWRPGNQDRGDPIHPDAREYAIAVADFALLYDGRRLADVPPPASDSNGLDALVHEARHPDRARHPEDAPEERAPAQVLSRLGIALEEGETGGLARRREAIRRAAGSPIAPPPRPEAISQKHHDPYLVNYRNEPIPLRIGSHGGAVPAFLRNPCREPGAASVGREPYRSIDGQRSTAAGSGGNLADVFRSAVHGDPCTPILEGLSEDRIVVRMIQGAQEVQHTFMVEGRPSRRNVDQPFPSERPAGPEGSAASRAAACALNPIAKGGDPLNYLAWATVGGGGSNQILPHYDALMRGCDNPLGYVAAQEIGISEHFEVGSLFSARGNVSAPALATRFAPRDDAPSPREDNPNYQPTFDHLFHFGSTDALWNGAWGLVRSYDSAWSPDISACLGQVPVGKDQVPVGKDDFEACLKPGGVPIGGRILPFATLRERLGAATAGGGSPALATGVAAPGPAAPPAETLDPAPETGDLVCPPAAPVVPATVAAVRAADVGVAADYGRGQSDPDGLLLVPLDAPGAGRPAAELRRTIRARLAGKASPFVLRVQAGDCLRLTVVNLLPEPPADGRCRGDRSGDAPGDAPMPRITPLNVDCDPRQFAGSPEPFPGKAGPRRPDLRPSGHLALSVPLPATKAARGTATGPAMAVRPAGALPVGANAATALPPADGGPAPWLTTDHYAGFLWPRAEDVAQQAASVFKRHVTREQDAGRQWTLAPLAGRACAPEFQVRALGFALCMDAGNPAPVPPIPAAEAQRAVAEAFATSEALYAGAVRAIPYAFGALPIRSLGDVVSHGAHGLLGVLVVEAAEPSGRSGPGDFGYRHDVARTIAAPAVKLGGEVAVKAATIHEHVLLWQDGLNLRRGGARATDLGLPGRPVADCPVCDDSYDLGEKGVGLASERFAFRLADLFASAPGVRIDLGLRTYPRDEDDLNRVRFPPDFFARAVRTPTIVAPPGGEMALRIAHPAGRARQRAFVPIFPGYDDLFPGFGSGHAALIGPGKGLTAWTTAPRKDGIYLWRDGPQAIFAAGAWGHLLVRPEAPAARTGR